MKLVGKRRDESRGQGRGRWSGWRPSEGASAYLVGPLHGGRLGALAEVGLARPKVLLEVALHLDSSSIPLPSPALPVSPYISGSPFRSERPKFR